MEWAPPMRDTPSSSDRPAAAAAAATLWNQGFVLGRQYSHVCSASRPRMLKLLTACIPHQGDAEAQLLAHPTYCAQRHAAASSRPSGINQVAQAGLTIAQEVEECVVEVVTKAGQQVILVCHIGVTPAWDELHLRTAQHTAHRVAYSSNQQQPAATSSTRHLA